MLNNVTILTCELSIWLPRGDWICLSGEMVEAKIELVDEWVGRYLEYMTRCMIMKPLINVDGNHFKAKPEHTW